MSRSTSESRSPEPAARVAPEARTRFAKFCDWILCRTAPAEQPDARVESASENSEALEFETKKNTAQNEGLKSSKAPKKQVDPRDWLKQDILRGYLGQVKLTNFQKFSLKSDPVKVLKDFIAANNPELCEYAEGKGFFHPTLLSRR